MRSVSRRSPQQFQRETNLARVLLDLRSNGGASRSQIADRLGIDRSTMTSLAAQLLEAGLAQEGQPQDVGSRGGRPARHLSLVSAAVVSAGISVTDREALWSILSLTGERLASGRVSRLGEPDSLAWLGIALEEANEAITSWIIASAGPALLAGIGVGLPGIVSHSTGVLRESTVLTLHDVSLESIWSQIPNTIADRIYCNNDANCAAWCLASSGSTSENLVVAHTLLHRTASGFKETVAGVGLAIVLGGEVLYGSADAAGEVRGYRWTPQARDQFGIGHDGDPEALVRSLLVEVVRGVGTIASAIDPDRVILAGDLSHYSEEVAAILADSNASGPAYPLAASGRFEIAASERCRVDHGAAQMVLNSLFTVPSVESQGDEDLSWQRILDRLGSAPARTPAPHEGARRSLQ